MLIFVFIVFRAENIHVAVWSSLPVSPNDLPFVSPFSSLSHTIGIDIEMAIERSYLEEHSIIDGPVSNSSWFFSAFFTFLWPGWSSWLRPSRVRLSILIKSEVETVLLICFKRVWPYGTTFLCDVVMVTFYLCHAPFSNMIADLPLVSPLQLPQGDARNQRARLHLDRNRCLAC